MEKDTLCTSFLRLSLFVAVHYVGKFIVRGVSHSHSKCRSDRLVHTCQKVCLTVIQDKGIFVTKIMLTESSSSTCINTADINYCKKPAE